MRTTLYSIFFLLTISVSAQKKVLDHPDFDIWNTIRSQSISNNGKFILYSLERGEKDRFLKIKDKKASAIFKYDRVEGGQFTYDSKNAIFKITAWKDSITEMQRRKVKKDKMQKDTLAIYNLSNKSLTKIANVKSYKVPQKWAGYVAYLLEDIKKPASKDAAKKTDKKEKPKKVKKVSAKNGYHLVIRNLATQKEDTIKYVTSY